MRKKEIAKLEFHVAKPTHIDLNLLQDWVVWQFPKQCGKGYCGAVHPPIEKHGWLPAIIKPEKNEAKIHGHLPERFETPELAADYFTQAAKAK
ncbi:MAG: hypothetical protein KC445_01630 [Anaerolineales bacterium]|nr:hypothetical protein [Anaerolineales bacterium]